jgi:hypothetical protein
MRTAYLFLFFCGACCLSAAQADDKILKAEELPLPRLFIGKKDNELWKDASKDGVIAGPKAWAKLWKTWGGDKDAPKVDFDKEIILVAAGPGPNIIKVDDLKLNDQGDLKFRWSITERGGDGFVAKLLKVSRAGVKTVNGKALPKE